ncbi:efflux RND transporter periplasmic adaptor subunit [bacterium]|nr:efflux RND transporter periplasmic adaptor subunit [bacterium]
MKMSDVRNLLKKRIVMVIGPIVFILGIILIFQVKSSASSVALFNVKRGEFVIDIQERGELNSSSSVTVSVPDRVYGDVRIVRVVEDGAMVKEGDFLVQFDTSEAERTVTDRQNELDNALAELASTKASIESNMKQLDSSYKTQQYSYEQAKLRFEQMKYEAESKRREQELNFKKADLALQQAQEKIESQKVIDQANIAKAEVRVKQAQMRRDQAQDQLDAMTLRSPKAGLVVLQEIYNWSTRTRDKVKVGDTPHRGMVLVSIPDLSVMLARTQINEVDISRVQLGQQAVITLDALPGPTFYGTITNIATLARRDEGSDVKVFDVDVTINEKDERLKPGMTAQCTLVTGRISDVLYVPLESVFEKADTTVVYIKDSGFSQRPIKVGRSNSDYIIVEDGLKEGEQVALRDPTLPLENLGAGEKVATSEVNKQNNNGSSRLMGR